MAKIRIEEYSKDEWYGEGFYCPGLDTHFFRDDVSEERRQELIQQIM